MAPDLITDTYRPAGTKKTQTCYGEVNKFGFSIVYVRIN